MVYGTIAGVGPAAAATVDVTVDNIEYSVTDDTTSFTSDEQTLENQPWWGNLGTAGVFAEDVAGDLGYQEADGGEEAVSPFFAYTPDSAGVDAYGYFASQYGTYVSSGNVPDVAVVRYAVASVIPSTPEPAPTAGVLLEDGIGVALRSRRRSVKLKGE
jgi:hypothetical protein